LLNYLLLPIFLLARISLQAEMTNDVLAKTAVLENNVAYLRVGEIAKNLAEAIQSAQTSLAATNKIVGTVLDLRFADGDDLDSEKSVKELFLSKKLPLAILVNDETLGAAAKLAADLREARVGLIFGSSKALKPDVGIVVNTGDEKMNLDNPFGTLPATGTNSIPTTNNFLSFIDHTSEADLVRQRITDGEQDYVQPSRPKKAPANGSPAPPLPIIRDPVLARAVDLIKGLAVLRQRPS
jgi:hypothetical protein